MPFLLLAQLAGFTSARTTQELERPWCGWNRLPMCVSTLSCGLESGKPFKRDSIDTLLTDTACINKAVRRLPHRNDGQIGPKTPFFIVSEPLRATHFYFGTHRRRGVGRRRHEILSIISITNLRVCKTRNKHTSLRHVCVPHPNLLYPVYRQAKYGLFGSVHFSSLPLPPNNERPIERTN